MNSLSGSESLVKVMESADLRESDHSSTDRRLD
jgi:hypothetical protein